MTKIMITTTGMLIRMKRMKRIDDSRNSMVIIMIEILLISTKIMIITIITITK